MTERLNCVVLMLAGALALAACSLETAINAMSSVEDRQFAQDFVSHLRAGDEAWIRARMDPGLAAATAHEVTPSGGLIPPEPAVTRLVGYQVSTHSDGGASERVQNFVLATEGGGRWAVTEIARRASGGSPALVIGWRVTPHTQRPAELAMFEASAQAVPFLWGLGIALVALLIAIPVLIMRSRRHKRAETDRAR